LLHALSIFSHTQIPVDGQGELGIDSPVQIHISESRFQTSCGGHLPSHPHLPAQTTFYIVSKYQQGAKYELSPSQNKII
jgi:hypothetical protein